MKRIISYIIVIIITGFFTALAVSMFFGNIINEQGVRIRSLVDQEWETRLKRIDSNRLFDKINEYRKENNLNPLEKREKACLIAKMRLGVLPDNWGHEKFLDTDWSYVYGYYQEMSENLSKGYTDVDTLLNGWKNSESHNRNLLINHKYGCVVCEYIRDGNYCVYISVK